MCVTTLKPQSWGGECVRFVLGDVMSDVMSDE